MKTDDLISMLSTNVEPVDHRQIVRNIGMAVVAGAAVAVATVFFRAWSACGPDNRSNLHSGALEGGRYLHHPGPGVNLPDQTDPPGRGTKIVGRLGGIAIYRRHAPCRT